MFPYIGLNYAVFEFLKPLALLETAIDEPSGRVEYSTVGLLGCGAASAVVAQVFAYPLDVVRHRVMVAGDWHTRYVHQNTECDFQH